MFNRKVVTIILFFPLAIFCFFAYLAFFGKNDYSTKTSSTPTANPTVSPSNDLLSPTIDPGEKREIENYIHKDAFERSCGRKISVIDDYEDIKKKLFNGKNGNSNFEKVIKEMTADEFLERDLCENGQNELIAIINSLIEFFNR